MPIINTVANASGRAYGFTRAGDSRVLLSATPGPSATITTYSGYIVFKFNATGTLNVGAGTPGTADVFVVGGGSTGANNQLNLPAGTTSYGGPGGNGGLRTASPAFSVTANTPIPIVVGSTATASSFGPVTSTGGSSGGSGGAGGSPPNSNIGQAGSNGPSNDYETGSSQSYGGGGGGGGGDRPSPFTGGFSGAAGGSGGSQGGGPGGSGYSRGSPFPLWGDQVIQATDGTPGTANSGGGGGGGGGAPSPSAKVGGTGGSGVVIARFPDTQFRTS